MATQSFGVVDYIVFGLMLLFSTAIGIVYAFTKSSGHDTFLLGDRKMAVTPVAISIMVTFLSAILILGCPAEMYMHGAQLWITVLAIAAVIPIVLVVFLPVFYRCSVTSVYEYIEMRFNSRLLRVLCVVTCLVQTTLYMGLALYAPSIALSSTTTVSLSTCIVAMAFVATFYTVLGGLKAVIWTDVLQSVVMAVGMVAIIVQASIDLGGFWEIFRTSAENGRLTVFDFTVDPWQRHNFWNVFFGSLFTWSMLLGVNQSSVQRYISLPSLRAAKMACFINGPFLFTYITLACVCGLAIFATYAHCDPVKLGLIDRKDKIVPFYVLDRMSYLPGLPGLFVACVMSGALSTVSSGLNSLAAITWKDFLTNIKSFQLMTARKQANVLRLISGCYGALAAGLALLASRLGGVMQLSIAINGAMSGPLFGVFSMGILTSFANSKGAIVGLLLAQSLSMWMVLGSSTKPATLPTDISGCSGNNTVLASIMTPTTVASHVTTQPNSWINKYIHSVSYQLYNLVGCLLCFTVGCVISLLTGGYGQRVKKNLTFSMFTSSRSNSEEGSASCRADGEMAMDKMKLDAMKKSCNRVDP